MADEIKRPGDQEQEAWTPASPAKRAMAWMGIVYMVILVLLTTYYLANGEPLRGIPGVLLFPAFGGLSALSLIKYREDKKGFLLLGGLVAAVLCLVFLVAGVLAVIRALGV